MKSSFVSPSVRPVLPVLGESQALPEQQDPMPMLLLLLPPPELQTGNAEAGPVIEAVVQKLSVRVWG